MAPPLKERPWTVWQLLELHWDSRVQYWSWDQWRDLPDPGGYLCIEQERYHPEQDQLRALAEWQWVNIRLMRTRDPRHTVQLLDLRRAQPRLQTLWDGEIQKMRDLTKDYRVKTDGSWSSNGLDHMGNWRAARIIAGLLWPTDARTKTLSTIPRG